MYCKDWLEPDDIKYGACPAPDYPNAPADPMAPLEIRAPEGTVRIISVRGRNGQLSHRIFDPGWVHDAILQMKDGGYTQTSKPDEIMALKTGTFCVWFDYGYKHIQETSLEYKTRTGGDK